MKTICRVGLGMLLCAFISLGPAFAQNSNEKKVEFDHSKLKLAKGYKEFHKKLITIDAVVPLITFSKDPKHFDWFIEGGVDVIGVSASIAFKDPKMTTDFLAWASEQIMTRDDLMLVRNTDDIVKANKEGKLGIFFHLQNPAPLQENLEWVWYYKALGVGLLQFAYNARSPYADGISEPSNGGLSNLGHRLVEACNEARIIIDVSHAGEKSALEMIEASKEPVVLSHGNAYSVINNPRNVSDKLLKAVAKNGGVAGVVGWPPFVSKSSHPTMDDLLAMIDHMVKVMGIDHVAVGMDFDSSMSGVLPKEYMQEVYEELVSSGQWDPKAYPPPPYYFPEGIENPSTYYNLTGALLAHGYSKEDVAKIWGGNWMRVMKQVWGDPKAKAIKIEKPVMAEQ